MAYNSPTTHTHTPCPLWLTFELPPQPNGRQVYFSFLVSSQKMGRPHPRYFRLEIKVERSVSDDLRWARVDACLASASERYYMLDCSTSTSPQVIPFFFFGK